MTSSFTARRPARVVQFVLAALVLIPAIAAAQTSATDTERPIGPVGFGPYIGWRTDYDDNVFRSNETKISDIVSTLSGGTGVHTRLRRLGITGNATGQWVHYATLVSERGANLSTAAKIDFAFNRFIPYVSTAYDNSRDRVGNEIDIRPRSERATLGIGGVVRLGGKTSLDLGARRSLTSFDKDAIADGVSLDAALNRSSSSVALSLMQEVTPLTRITFGGELQRDNFTTSGFRSSDETRLTVGFDSDGRIKGSARGGLRMNKPHDPVLTESRGLFLSVGTSMTVKERLQIGIDAQRDFAPSYRPGITFFDSSSYGISLSYAIRRSLRFSATTSLYRADYRDEPFSSFDNRLGIDTELRYGSGINYLLGDSLSLDVSGMYSGRTSQLAFREFDGFIIRAGVSHAF